MGDEKHVLAACQPGSKDIGVATVVQPQPLAQFGRFHGEVAHRYAGVGDALQMSLEVAGIECGDGIDHEFTPGERWQCFMAHEQMAIACYGNETVTLCQ